MSTCKLKIASALSSIVALLLAACGGGGGGGGDGGALPTLQYAGNSSAAVVTPGNASQLVANVFGGDTSTIDSSVTGVSTEGTGALQGGNDGLTALTQRLNGTFRNALVKTNRARSAQRSVLAGASVNETEQCDSGSVRTTGTINDNNGTGTLTLTFNACRTGDETLSGQATIRVDTFDLGYLLPTDFTVSFGRLTIRSPAVSLDAGGSTHVQLSIPTNTETITDNLVSLDNVTRGMTRTENLVYVNVYDSVLFPSSATSTLHGRVFDSVQGFVDVTTIAPAVFGSVTQLFPQSGQMLMTGSGARTIRVAALSATMATLALDLDGNGVDEIAARLKWTDLTGPVGADLADTDGDGMHNGWEVANGLNPTNPADAALDADGDGASNLAEYQADSDPKNVGSAPQPVSLSISMSDAPDPATIGNNLVYTVTVQNSSSGPASSVIVADSLPPSVTLVSATPSRGTCIGTTSIRCNLGTLNSFNSAVVTIVVNLTAEGVVNNTATVTSGSFDPNLADNSATSTTTVGQPVAGIQGLIDAANTGDTVLVVPGTYYGGLNFNGKNITLQSSAGPSSTIIHGNQGTGVRIGPAGAIKGFTITGSSASFGAGIEVISNGSVISGNIFDGNAQGAGGYGAAIGGNAASPIIERNIFRNNTCDNQFLSGVVGFINGSSPVIVNNVFENNPCRGINLSLIQGNTPQVLNNTFVGNRAAVYVSLQAPQTTQIFHNNLIFQNGIGLETDSGTAGGNPIWANNLVFGNTTNYQGISNQTGISGNISVNPMLVNATLGNYHLQTGSPAIDAGSALGAPGVDFDGAFRPFDGNGDSSAIVDIGAFEAH